jgi:hypothetical protein
VFQVFITYLQGIIAGLDRWIAQSGLQSNLVHWIVIDNPKSKSDFGFGLSIQFCHFNPNPIYHNYFIKKLKCHAPTMLSQATFYPNFQTNNFSVR